MQWQTRALTILLSPPAKSKRLQNCWRKWKHFEWKKPRHLPYGWITLFKVIKKTSWHSTAGSRPVGICFTVQFLDSTKALAFTHNILSPTYLITNSSGAGSLTMALCSCYAGSITALPFWKYLTDQSANTAIWRYKTWTKFPYHLYTQFGQVNTATKHATQNAP